MLWLKGCPRCKGDLLALRYSAGEHSVSCLQCGHTLSLSQERELQRHAAGPAQVARRTPAQRRRATPGGGR